MKKEVEHISIGKIGEDMACEYLKRKGYRVLDRNYREKFGEIDIICKNKGTLIFIEIKTIKSEKPSETGLQPEDNLTSSKLQKLKKICDMFVAKQDNLLNEKKGYRIDLLAISLDRNNSPQFRHYENIF